jgi:hypothetical protein
VLDSHLVLHGGMAASKFPNFPNFPNFRGMERITEDHG